MEEPGSLPLLQRLPRLRHLGVQLSSAALAPSEVAGLVSLMRASAAAGGAGSPGSVPGVLARFVAESARRGIEFRQHLLERRRPLSTVFPVSNWP
jgi:predicted anti-sigma-YlaC factor YlaD